MNKKIKMIELLNIIANGEEVPEKIKVKDYVFIWKVLDDGVGYFNVEEGTGYYWLEDYMSLDSAEDLNTEVEILEDNTKEIEELKPVKDRLTYRYEWSEIPNKINELVKAVNGIRKELNI